MTLFRCAAVAAAIAAVACGGNKTTTPTVSQPRYNGSWTGTYTVTSCSQDGQFAAGDACGFFTNGRVLPYGFVTTQTNSNVSGTFVLGMVNFAFASTPIASDGSLTITGTGTAPDTGFLYGPTWALRLNGTLLTGSLTMSLTATGLTGGAAVAATISTSTKVTVVASQTAPAGLMPRSIGEALGALATAP